MPRHRLVISERLGRAALVPQFSLERTIDARAAREVTSGVKGVTLTHLLLQAVAVALREFPRVNRRWIEEGPRYQPLVRCDVGLAVATDDNLIVATIPEPDLVGLPELAETVRAVVEQVRRGRLPAGNRGPAAATVSNLGMFGVDRFQAIVDPDQSVILAVGRVITRPVVTDNGIFGVPQLDLTLTVDHRVADGAEAARFFEALCKRLDP
jgi:pyruvate dehydrogenase E2 component (dihydrolipoamide acetyltransferase)